MSYNEYEREFINAQNNPHAPYRMFAFDLKNSKMMDEDVRYDAQIKSIETMKLLALALKEVEDKIGKRILFFDERVKLNVNMDAYPSFLGNPSFSAGDAFVISIFNGSCSDEEMIDYFLQCAKEVGNNYPYNVSMGNFETTDYSLATKKCYIGYCAAKLDLDKNKRKFVVNIDKLENELFR